MTLNKTQTALLQAAISGQTNFLYWLKNDTTTISNTEYSVLKSAFEAWKIEYDNQTLYGTNANESTFQFSGIDQFPVPISR